MTFRSPRSPRHLERVRDAAGTAPSDDPRVSSGPFAHAGLGRARGRLVLATAAVVGLAVAVIAGLIDLGSGVNPATVLANARASVAPAHQVQIPTPAATPTPVRSPAPAPAPSALPVAPGAGALPQTSALPRANSTAFHNAMADLWLAVTTDKASFARPAFFPLAAYQQLKAIPYPTSDWQYRLWTDFTADIGAAHQVVGKGARFVRAIVPTEYAHWVPPGVCANSIGYWEVPGARVVYRQGGQERSFGIASMISWRGVWYVVHFGAVLRGSATGLVYDPATGPGIPGPPGGC